MKKMHYGKCYALLLFILILAASAAADTYLSNSRDWRDVYSVMLYGGIQETTSKFLVSDRHGPLILNSLRKGEPLEVFTSEDQPFMVGYESMIEGAGFQAVAENKYGNMNLELAERLPEVKDYIIVDDAYGYNAIAVAPYAVLSKTYVLFADSMNIDQVVDILDRQEAEDIIIYGSVDREVREALEEYEPEIINQDGDRFANNVEIVKKYREIYPKKQVVLTNGEFIEAEIMSGVEPVLFIGRENVPDKIKEYIQSTDIEVGVLIGNELVGTATIVRRQVGISTFVKFAQGARASAGSIAQVEDLDRFPVPKVELDLEIISVKYNKLTGMVEITFKNNADVVTYLKGTYTLKIGDEEIIFGDDQPVFIDKNDVYTLVYKIEDALPEGEITLDAYVVYGESKNSMELVIDETFSVSTIEVDDDAQISITKVQYDKSGNRFLIFVKNIGEVDAYVNTELVDLMILGEVRTIGSDDTIHLSPGETKKSVVRAELSDSDLEDNPLVRVRARYGARQDALIKVLEGEFEVSVKAFDLWTYLPVILILLLLLLIFLGRKRCRNCGHKNPRSRKTCKKCGHKL